MSQPSPTAGGFFLILAIIAGFAIGVTLGQPMIGVVGGTAAGTVIALLLWWRDRRRKP